MKTLGKLSGIVVFMLCLLAVAPSVDDVIVQGLCAVL